MKISKINWNKIEKNYKYSFSRGKNYNTSIWDVQKIINFFKTQIEKQIK